MGVRTRSRPASDAVVVALAVGWFQAVRKQGREAVGIAIFWDVLVSIGLGVLEEEDSSWSDVKLVVAIAAASWLWCSL